MKEIVVLILVSIFIYISYKALIYNYITLKMYFSKQSHFIIITSVFIVLGIMLGLVFASTQYKINQRYTAISLPIPVAFFEYQNGKIIDYVNPLTFPIMLINFFIGFGFVEIAITSCILVLKRKIVKESA